jgi:hypothetical protein
MTYNIRMVDLMEQVAAAKSKCRNPDDSLTSDESASIRLYTDGGGKVSRLLNEALRDEDRQKLKPWHSLLFLLLTALAKLP